ncbi:MAG: ATP-binding protein [Planctomycetota bacterium]|nr:ATP-binding protein [Planctomycetota bacterium]
MIKRTTETSDREPREPKGGGRETEEFLRTILAGVRASLREIRADFKIVSREGGGRPLQTKDARYEEFFSFTDPCPLCPAKTVFETGLPEKIVTPLETRDGDGKVYEIHALPLKSPDGSVDNVIELIRDVTEEKRLEERYQVSEQLAAVGRLAAGIAHEIKNPLGIILTSSQILTNLRRPAEQRAEASEILTVEVERLSKIVNDFLRYARPGPLHRSLCNLNDLIHETVSIWSAGRGERGVRCLEEDLDPTEPRVLIDQDQMRQVILNLLINAYEATGIGGKLTIRTKDTKDGWVELSFIDDGPGFSEEVLPKIFEPFFTTKEAGTGLGLSIVKRIIDAHSGEILLENQAPRGAACRIRLPDRAATEE